MVIVDQLICYKGDGFVLGLFDYFLVLLVLCVVYFVKLYCQMCNIFIDNICLLQNNIVDLENCYWQIFKIQVELLVDILEKDCQGIFCFIDCCMVKKVVQIGFEFVIEEVDNFDVDVQVLLMFGIDVVGCMCILGKDLLLEQIIVNLLVIFVGFGMKIEIVFWCNIVFNVWLLYICDVQLLMCFINGKGVSKESVLVLVLGEFIEWLNCNFFYNDQYWGEEIVNVVFVYYLDECWFKFGCDDVLLLGLFDGYCLVIYDFDGELCGLYLYDINLGNVQCGICVLFFVCQFDGQVVYFFFNLIENFYFSNGMSVGNILVEVQVQCLLEIFECVVKW